MQPVAVSLPRVGAVDGEQLRHLLLAQLQHPELERCTILSYRYNDFDLIAGPRRRNTSTSLLRLLEKICEARVALTFVARNPLSETATPSHVVREWRRGLGILAKAGARVKIHPSLHAKVYLFKRRGNHVAYAVGSSNLTYQGLGFAWAECNVRGFHATEWDLVDRHAGAIAAQSGVLTLDQWDVVLRRDGDKRFVREVFE